MLINYFFVSAFLFASDPDINPDRLFPLADMGDEDIDTFLKMDTMVAAAAELNIAASLVEAEAASLAAEDALKRQKKNKRERERKKANKLRKQLDDDFVRSVELEKIKELQAELDKDTRALFDKLAILKSRFEEENRSRITLDTTVLDIGTLAPILSVLNEFNELADLNNKKIFFQLANKEIDDLLRKSMTGFGVNQFQNKMVELLYELFLSMDKLHPGSFEEDLTLLFRFKLEGKKVCASLIKKRSAELKNARLRR